MYSFWDVVGMKKVDILQKIGEEQMKKQVALQIGVKVSSPSPVSSIQGVLTTKLTLVKKIAQQFELTAIPSYD